MSNLFKEPNINYKQGNEIKPTQPNLSYKDLCVAEKIWNHALMSTLVDIRIACIPVIHAAANEKIPKKPPPMKYSDLPLSECNEFYEYKTYLEETEKCPDADVKLLHTFLCPIVHKYRIAITESVCGMARELRDMKNEAYDEAHKHVLIFKKYMRHPDNLLIRRAFLVLSTLTGAYIGSGTRGVSKKIFYGTIGALAGGALCFPKETDVVFRNTLYNVSKLVIALYNVFCRKNLALRERVPCPEDLPPPPPNRQYHQINKRCEDPKLRAQAKAAEAAKAAAKAAEEMKRRAAERAAAQSRCCDE